MGTGGGYRGVYRESDYSGKETIGPKVESIGVGTGRL